MWFAILISTLLTGCTSFLYYPNAYKYMDEKLLEYPPLDVDLAAGDQTDLLNWYFEAKPQSRLPVTIIFVHGNAQNMSAHFRSLYWVLNEGLNFFAVEFPGYGPNGGSPSPASTVESVQAAFSWVRKNRPSDSIFIYGQSLGGNVALRALSETPDLKACGVAIEGSFESYQNIAQSIMSRNWILWPIQWLPFLVIDDSKSIRNNYQNLPSTRYLVIHGDDDQTIPLAMGQELYGKLPSSKEFWLVQGGGHIDTFGRYEEYRSRFADFVKKNCLVRYTGN